MSYKPQRLSKLAKEFNVGVDTILEFLGTKAIGLNRNSKIESDVYDLLVAEYKPDMIVKAEAKQQKQAQEEANKIQEESNKITESEVKVKNVPELKLKVLGNIALEQSNSKTDQVSDETEPKINDKKELEDNKTDSIIRAKANKLDGPKILEGKKSTLINLIKKKIALLPLQVMTKKRKKEKE